MPEPQLTILHVDDNETNRYVVSRILQNAGFAVVEAATGAAGLGAIADHQPALVILDVQLPDLSGFEVCRQIKANPETASIPVLHLSATFTQSQDKAEGLDSGADAYLAQPVEPIELLATMRSLLRIRRAEEAALVSAGEWQTTFDSIHDSVCLVDQEGRILRCNKAMSQLFGKPDHEILGCIYHELMLAVMGAGDGACFRLAKETHQRQVLELHARERWFAKTMDPVLDSQRRFTGAVFILTDITDRKRADAALRESETRFRQMTDAAPMLVWMAGTDALCYYFNQPWLNFTGRSLTQEMGNGWVEGIHADDAQHCLSIYTSAFNARQSFEMDYRLRRADGAYRWVLDKGNPRFTPEGEFLGYVGSCVDIHDRKQAEAALRESEALKQRILESSKDCIKVLALDGRLLYLNKGGVQLLEIDDPSSLLQAEWLSFWQGEEKEMARDALATAKTGGVGQLQGYSPTAKGTPKWWDVLVTPVEDAAGQVANLLVVSRDITRQKQADAEREQLLVREQVAREQAETANRIKDEFLAVLSHELRSPLNPILGWVRILQTSQQDKAQTQYALETIERNAKLQAQLIEDLLDVSRILQGKLSLQQGSIGLTFTIKAALETVRLAAEAKAIQIQTIFAPNVGQVLGDSNRLQQVVWNLLTNAIKFTPQSGRVQVKLEETGSGEWGMGNGEMPNHSLLPTPRSPSYAQITVSDTGKGIAPEFLPHVFDYFRQADGTTTRHFGGLGLGLAIVRYLVELHGGTVEAASPGEGQGATFTVKLPVIAAASLQQADTLSPDRSEFTFNGLQVLVVDDDRDSRELITFLLQQHGAAVTEVASASEALSCLRQASFALLISDIGMPAVDGYALIRQIRQQTPDQCGKMPAIALTAYAGEIDQQQALAAGFQHHLTKPVEPELLMQTICTLVESKDDACRTEHS